MSDTLSAFAQYATAFEEAYVTDEWGRVESCFDDDIVWASGGPDLPTEAAYFARGRSQASAAVRNSCNLFDRRFDRREPGATSGPVTIPGGIHMEWAVTYTRGDLPPFQLRGEEWDLFAKGGWRCTMKASTTASRWSGSSPSTIRDCSQRDASGIRTRPKPVTKPMMESLA